MKKCENCHFLNEDGASTCSACGAPFEVAKKQGESIKFKVFNNIAIPLLAILFCISLNYGNGLFFNINMILFVALFHFDAFVLIRRSSKRYGTKSDRIGFAARLLVLTLSFLSAVLSGTLFWLVSEWYTLKLGKILPYTRQIADNLAWVLLFATVFFAWFATFSIGWILSYIRTGKRAVKPMGAAEAFPPARQKLDRVRLVLFLLAHPFAFFAILLFALSVLTELRIPFVETGLFPFCIFAFLLCFSLLISFDRIDKMVYRKLKTKEEEGSAPIWEKRPLDAGNKGLFILWNMFLVFVYVFYVALVVLNLDVEIFLWLSLLGWFFTLVLLLGYNGIRWVLSGHRSSEESEDKLVTVSMEETPVGASDNADDTAPFLPEEVEALTKIVPEKLSADDPVVGRQTLLTEGGSLSMLFSRFCEGMPSADQTYARGLLAAMASSRLLIFADDSFPEKTTLPVIADTFDAPLFLLPVASGDHSVARLVYTKEPDTGHMTHSPLYSGCFWAEKHEERAFFVGLSKIAESNLSVLSSLTPYLAKPYGKTVLLDEENGSSAYHMLTVNENVWFFADAKRSVPVQMDLMLAETSSVIAVRHGADVPVPTVGEAPSVPLFLRLCATCEDLYGLSEETWKKIDALEEYLKSTYGFSFHNKFLRAVEKYVAVYMACGGTEEEALDSALAAKVLPVVASLMRDAASRVGEPSAEQAEDVEDAEEGETLPKVLARLFGADKLPLSVDFLRLMNGRSDSEE